MRINFRDNKHSVALTLDCIGHNPFSTAVSVHLRGINQLHAEINPQTQRRDFIGMCPFPFAHAPRALTQHGNARAIGKCDGFHFVIIFIIAFVCSQGREPCSENAMRQTQPVRLPLQNLR